MAISNVEGSGNFVETQNLKDQYDEREKNMATRHGRQLSEAEERNARELEELRRTYDEKLQDIRERNRETLTHREKGHIKEIKDLQDTSRKKLVQLKGDEDFKFNSTRRALESELALTRQKDQRDKDRLEKAHMEQWREKSIDESEWADNMREKQEEAIETVRNKLQNAHEDDSDNLRTIMREENTNNSQSLTNLRREKDREIQRLRTEIAAQRKTLETKYIGALDEQRRNYDGILTDARNEYGQGTAESKKKYHDLQKNLTEQFEQNYDNLQQLARERLDGEIIPARQTANELRNYNAKEMFRLKRTDDKARADLARSMQNNINELEKRRQEQLAISKQINDQNIKKVHAERDAQAVLQTKESLNRLHETKSQGQNAYDSATGGLKQALEDEKTKSDTKSKKMRDYYATRTVEDGEFYSNQLARRTKDHEEILQNQRDNMLKQKDKEVGDIRGQMAVQNKQQSEKLMDTVTNYERRMQALKADYEKKLKRQDELMRESNQRALKASEMDREAQEAKLNARLTGLKDMYEREMTQMRRRYEQERNQQMIKKS